MDLFFQPLEKFLFASPNFDTVNFLLQQATSQRDQAPINAITKLLLNRKLYFKALEGFLPQELAAGAGLTLFRDNVTPSTGLLVSFLTLKGRDYVKNTLGATVQVMLRKPFCVDFHNESLSLSKQLKKLFRIVEKILTRLFSSQLPKEIMTMMAFLMKNIDEPLKEKGLNALELIVSSLFLHLICPVFIDPQQYNIPCDEISLQSRQVLTWVTKILQKIACATDFAVTGQPHIDSINQFIGQKREAFQSYISDLLKKCVPSSPALSLHLCPQELDEKTEFTLWKTIYRYIKRKNQAFKSTIERFSPERSFEYTNELQSLFETIEARRSLVDNLGGEEDFFSDPCWAEEVFTESHSFISSETRMTSSGIKVPKMVFDSPSCVSILNKRRNRSSPCALEINAEDSDFTVSESFNTSSNTSTSSSTRSSSRSRSVSSSSTAGSDPSMSPVTVPRSKLPCPFKKRAPKDPKSLAFTGLYSH
eukprot:TRINITY_DN837_c0_g1_i8.p1 TRINITY_DN837_c0_g1~~TRINITY_DN837_c0_g1_i8.p1  ORF type:complete len:511 (+),score=270.77 TRINITY_DN837_c0_g1_i8:104-1534(+)